MVAFVVILHDRDHTLFLPNCLEVEHRSLAWRSDVVVESVVACVLLVER